MVINHFGVELKKYLLVFRKMGKKWLHKKSEARQMAIYKCYYFAMMRNIK